MVSRITESSSSHSIHTAKSKKIQLPTTSTEEKTNKVASSCFKKCFICFKEKINSFFSGIGKFFKVLFCSGEDSYFSSTSNLASKEPTSKEGSSSNSSTSEETVQDENSRPNEVKEETLEDRLKQIEELRIARKAAAAARASGVMPTAAAVVKKKEKITPPKLTPEEKKKAEELKAKAKAEKIKKAEKKKKREIEKKKAKIRKEVIEALSNPIALKSPATKVVGLHNFNGANCYMNAAIQGLEINLLNDKKFHNLLNQKLEKAPEETLTEFEERVLKDWAPLQPGKKESQDNFEDRILFKWSFLQLIQAKKSGASKSEVTEALKIHHKVCFGLRLHPDFLSGPMSQKDSGEYLGMWCDVLEWHPFIKYDKTRGEKDGVVYKQAKKLEVLNILRLPINIKIKRKELKKIQKQIKEFSEKKDAEIAEIKKNADEEIAKARENMPAKKTEKDQSPAQVKKLEAKRKAIKKSISNLEKAKQSKIAKLEKAKIQFADNKREKAEKNAVLDGAKILANYFADETIPNVKFLDETVIVPIATRENKLAPKMPKSFMLQLQRFHGAKNHCGKFDNKIDMKKLMTIDLRPYLKNPKDSVKSVYELNGFIVHHGGLDGGHYISYVKMNNQWYECDDFSVKVIPEKKLPTQDAYLCSYIRA